MVDIQSKEVIDKISDELKVQPAMAIPKALAEKIQLVYQVNAERRATVVASKSKTSTGTITVLATPTDRDFFLTNVYFAWKGDAANTGTELLVTVDVDGQAIETELFAFNKVPSVVTADHINMPLNPPIKMARGGNIKMTQIFAAGTGGMECTVVGYTTDPQ